MPRGFLSDCSVLPLVAVSLLSTGCFIEIVDGKTARRSSTGAGGTSDSSDWSDSSSSTGSSGKTTTSTTTGSGGGMGTTSSTGSGMQPPDQSSCVPAAGYGMSASVCDSTPAATVKCGASISLAYGSCKRGFAIFEAGQAEDLAACIAKIPAAQACAVEPVSKCIDAMYARACTDSKVIALCNEWTSVCGQSGQALNAKKCAADLNPFNEGAIDAMVACLNKSHGSCQQRYDACFDAALSID